MVEARRVDAPLQYPMECARPLPEVEENHLLDSAHPLPEVEEEPPLRPPVVEKLPQVESLWEPPTSLRYNPPLSGEKKPQ